MQRYRDGKVDINGTSVTIPKDELALSMFACNSVIDKAEYKKDGWIYVSGKPVRKWFKDCYSPGGESGSIRIWEPILSNIALLEARRWKVKAQVKRFYNKVWKPIFDELVEVGSAHAKPTHKFNSFDDKTWWLYAIHEYGESHSIAFDWVNEPAVPKDSAIGQAYYHAECQISRYHGYEYKFSIALGAAIIRYLRKEYPPKETDIPFRLILNGRDYWYISRYIRHGVDWAKVAWAESPVIEVIMREEIICTK